MPRLNIIRTLFALIMFVAAAAGAGAQTFRGGISGRVIDPSDAVLPSTSKSI